jgi:hypothetical protein
MGAEYHVDERTDMTQLIFAFRNFANAPKNGQFFVVSLLHSVNVSKNNRSNAMNNYG